MFTFPGVSTDLQKLWFNVTSSTEPLLMHGLTEGGAMVGLLRTPTGFTLWSVKEDAFDCKIVIQRDFAPHQLEQATNFFRALMGEIFVSLSIFLW